MKSSIKGLFVLLALGMSFVTAQAVCAQETPCIDFKPDTLNINSGSKWVTVYIELDGYNPADIDVSTILLNGEVVPVLDPNYCFVANEDCYLVDATCEPVVIERMVKFNRGDVAAILPLGEEVEITITGKLNDGTTSFEGTDVIPVIEGAFEGHKGDVNCDGAITVSDVRLIANIFLGASSPPTDREFWFADCDGNGSINVADILIAINKILGAN
jgi:hypothetical protein